MHALLSFYHNSKRNGSSFCQSVEIQNFKSKIGLEYIEKIKTISSNKIVTDKLPFNFFYIGSRWLFTYDADLIAASFSQGGLY